MNHYTILGRSHEQVRAARGHARAERVGACADTEAEVHRPGIKRVYNHVLVAAAAGVALALGACGGSQPPPDDPSSADDQELAKGSNDEGNEQAVEDAASAAPTSAEQQIAQGQELYGSNCASCHGDAGQGVSAPPVVGKDALPKAPPAGAKFRKSEFKTAADVAQFVVSSMPPGKAGSLSTDQYLAILAFDLSANGVALTEPLTLEGAAEIVLHP